MARIVSTAAGYLQLARAPDGDEPDAWVRDYEARYPSIFQSYYSGWGKVERRTAAASRERELAPAVASLESRAHVVVERAEAGLQARGLLDDAPVPAVLLVGVGSSNGWVASFEGSPTLFLAWSSCPTRHTTRCWSSTR
jgi:hypothetical protein